MPLLYRSPLRDIQFLFNDVLNAEQHYQSLTGCQTVTPDLLAAILQGAAKFAEEVCAPLNQVGDSEGCKFDNGRVTTPQGFKDAFKQYAAEGWQGMTEPETYGGQGLPASLGISVGEMMGGANWALNMYAGLALAPVTCLMAAGSDEQKQRYIPNILNGTWAGTMCLTEPHCGSDVGLARTKAVKNADGTYSITGTKMFISGGEQDLTENIIHAVLARVEGAQKGTKGISLFIVPKILVNDDGSLGEANKVAAGSIEKKMGNKGNATCVLNFDGATGYLVGEENKGMAIMFKMMNQARIGTAVQGMTLSQLSFQGALDYARERTQMRAISGAQNPDGEADPIICHGDVRRMLLTQKALVEGNRAFIYWISQLMDTAAHGPEEERQTADDILSLLTPIAKAFCTETAIEVTNLGIQVFGGHGYIHENGMEQVARDCRIAAIWEGTTGIQALDLIGRKVMGSGGKLLRSFTKLVYKYCEANKDHPALGAQLAQLAELNNQWGDMTGKIGEVAMGGDAEIIGTASVDYLMFGGYVVLGYMWAQMAMIAQAKIAAGLDADGFYAAKLQTAEFYFARIMPRAKAHAEAALAPTKTCMGLAADKFLF